MNPSPTDTTPTERTCSRCARSSPYDPIMIFGHDLRASIAFHCAECAAKLEADEQEDARQRIRERRQAAWEKTVPAKYRETDLSHPLFNKALWEMVRSINIFRDAIGLIGPSGRSKTRVFALLAKRAIAADHYVGWCPANSFQWAAQREFDKDDGPDARRWLKRWTNAPVLFLDDLGKHRWTDAVEAAFFAMLESRASHNLPTHWSLNPDPGEDISPAAIARDTSGILARALDSTGAAIARARFAPILSRLQDGTSIISVP